MEWNGGDTLGMSLPSEDMETEPASRGVDSGHRGGSRAVSRHQRDLEGSDHRLKEDDDEGMEKASDA